jgi:SAM-dependent methyltransferase
MDVRDFNRTAWNSQVKQGNTWTIPVSPQQVADARAGGPEILLTPTKFVPAAWFPPLTDARVLCLASGGGQQGPLLAAAGAVVTVYDNSPAQLARDRDVAEREGLAIEIIEGDMRDLGVFSDERFDLIVHPVSNVFVPDIQPVWNECYRVLNTGGRLLSGFDNPIVHLFDEAAYERGELIAQNRLPYSDLDSLSPDEIESRRQSGRPLEFGHTLEQQIGGQIAAGFSITGFYEDRYPASANDPLADYSDLFIATAAVKRPLGPAPRH